MSQLGFFAKHWTPGEVKTRLAQSIGDRCAATIAKLFIQTMMERLGGLADQRVVGYAPAEKRSAFEELVTQGWRLTPQSDGDLGHRIHRYFEEAWASGGCRAVLLGSDSPNVPISYVTQALASLERCRLVLGPTEDGGYYLVGARGETPPIFDQMPWSEPTLWQATLDRLEHRGWRRGREYEVLPSWYDVDETDDLARLRNDLAIASEPPLLRLAQELNRM